MWLRKICRLSRLALKTEQNYNKNKNLILLLQNLHKFNVTNTDCLQRDFRF